NDTATTEIYPLSLHDALPIWSQSPAEFARSGNGACAFTVGPIAERWVGFPGRLAAEPDALRLSGAVFEGAGAGANGQRGAAHAADARVGVCGGNRDFVLGACGRAAGAAGSRRQPGMGIPVPVAGVSGIDGGAAFLFGAFAGRPI